MNLETLLLPIVETYYDRYCKKFATPSENSVIVGFGPTYQFFALHCGLTRQQTKSLAKVFEELGWLKVEQRGWRLLRGGAMKT